MESLFRECGRDSEVIWVQLLCMSLAMTLNVSRASRSQANVRYLRLAFAIALQQVGNGLFKLIIGRSLPNEVHSQRERSQKKGAILMSSSTR